MLALTLGQRHQRVERWWGGPARNVFLEGVSQMPQAPQETPFAAVLGWGIFIMISASFRIVNYLA